MLDSICAPTTAKVCVIALLATAAALRSGVAASSDCRDAARMGACIDADTLWPHAGAARFQSVGATETTAPSQFSFGLVASWLRKPVVLKAAAPNPEGTQVPAVDHLVDTTFLWAYGVTDRLELTLAMPTTVYEKGSGLSSYTSSNATALPKTAVRDFRFGFAYGLLARQRSASGSPLALTGRFEMSAPVGDEQSFAGDRATVWVPSLAADYRWRRLFVGVETGARVRNITNLAGTRVGTQWLGALGVGVDLLRQELLSAEIEAYVLASPVAQETVQRNPQTGELVTLPRSRPHIPAEWMATVRSAPARGGDFAFSLSAGTALPLTDPVSVTTPAYRVVAGVRYAPLARDTDKDGVLDKDDQCPDQREDRDGFQDEDGCPDPDNDRDGISDEQDRCRDTPEDHDGFQDEDGCPDLDDDHDGVPDVNDQCRSKPEDRDGFQDGDGCPDPDNDGDGIPDVNDLCPDAAEDFDAFNDQDGCPDPDNDIDAVPDARDQCPNSREDKDGFQDEDGCPDPDNDQDGIADELDKCPLQPETINGVEDADGCPEPGATDLTVVAGGKVSVTNPLPFAPNQFKLTPALHAQLRMIAQRARGLVPIDSIIVEAFGDAPGDTPAAEALASKRADAVRGVLVESGLAPEKVVGAVGDLTTRRSPSAPQYDVLVKRGRFK
jgi:OmpA-OmpF porin, OOP family